MAEILPFQPYRYTRAAGPLAELLTQPYDKISPEMQARYHAASPNNFAHVILGAGRPGDTPADSVYTRAAAALNHWIASGIMEKDPEPGFYPYFQDFTVPDTGDRVTRKGFIGLGPAVDYSEGIVFRHEQTLKGPKADRLELLRHTHAHTGQLFFLYGDREFAVDAILDQAASGPPLVEVSDEYDVEHRLWKISDPDTTAEITRIMADKKLLIADGHHRYETARAFSAENPDLAAARHVMMTLVNMYSPGLKVLATHRLVHGLEGFQSAELERRAAEVFDVRTVDSAGALKDALAAPDPAKVRIGLATDGGERICLLEKPRAEGELDVVILHDVILGKLLGISAEAVRNQTHTRYIRGLDAAAAQVASGAVQAAFLLAPVSPEQVAEVSFGGGVMPQKSTDFYPKLLSGLTVYSMEG